MQQKKVMMDPISFDFAHIRSLKVTSSPSPPLVVMPSYFTEISNLSKYCIVAYCILFLSSSVGNTYVFISLYKQLKHRRTRTSLLILNLCIADLIVTFFLIPMEIAWRITIQWYGGDILCRLCQFFRAFGLYSSSMIVICISVDRFFAIIYPLKFVGVMSRIKIMLWTAWSSAFLFALPQIFVFHVTNHPRFLSFEQCVSTFFVWNYPDEELYYNLFSISALYVVPLFVILFTYSMILCKIYRKSQSELSSNDITKHDTVQSSNQFCEALLQTNKVIPSSPSIDSSKDNNPRLINKSLFDGGNNQKSSGSYNKKPIPIISNIKEFSALRIITTSTNILSAAPATVVPLRPHRAIMMARARKRTLRLTLLILISFLVCWTPYVVMTLWYMLDREGAQAVDPWIQEVLFLMAVCSSVLDPLIYYGTCKKKSKPINYSYRCPCSCSSVKSHQQSLKMCSTRGNNY